MQPERRKLPTPPISESAWGVLMAHVDKGEKNKKEADQRYHDSVLRFEEGTAKMKRIEDNVQAVKNEMAPLAQLQRSLIVGTKIASVLGAALLSLSSYVYLRNVDGADKDRESIEKLVGVVSEQTAILKVLTTRTDDNKEEIDRIRARQEAHSK